MTTGNSRLFFLVSLTILGSALSADVLEGNYNVTAFCTVVPVGTLLGSIVSCDYYYACTSTGPVNTSCSANYSFDLANQKCNPTDQVTCYYGVENVCASITGKGWVPNTGTCNGWIYCENGEYAGNGTCGSNQKFDEASSTCIYGKCPTVLATTDGPTLTSNCEVVPPDFYFGDTIDCKKWNYCTANKSAETGECTSSAFIVESESCGYDNNNVCSRVTETELGTATGECGTNGAVKGDSSVCGTYLQCDGTYWQPLYCASGYYFDTLNQTCLPRQEAVATPGCDRCQYATKTWVNAVDNSTCSNYLYCKNGVGEPVSCTSGNYFNEEKQGCVSNSTLVAYAADHGACHGAGSTSDNSTTTLSTEDNETTEATESGADEK
ncbi:peritrophin-48 [Drosophila tropicalis]|uniref:peritrophin-48 n=1 Tax=Drosophila tropicalis TaxID=46794 RepID=UPI0035AB9475